MKKIFLITLLTMTIALSGSGSASALLLPRMTVPELVAQASSVVSGKCLSLHFHPDQDGKTLYAIIKFKVDEYLKNDLGKEEIFLMQIAREEDQEGIRQPGAISFQVDEEAILFLTGEDNEGFRHVMSLSQGKFSVRENRKGERYLLRDLKDVQWFDRKTGEISKVKQSQEEINLDVFRREVIQTVSRLKAKKQELIFVTPNRSL